MGMAVILLNIFRAGHSKVWTDDGQMMDGE